MSLDTPICARLRTMLDQLADLPPGTVLEGADVGEGYARDASEVPGVRPCIVLRPGSTAELSRMLAACHDAGQPVVVQGGRTGLAGGASAREGEVSISLERMTALSEVDVLTSSVTAEAGVPLLRVQEAAEAAGMRFAVDLGARGSATMGGMVATNAGGIRVMRHGMMRAQVLGLEVVLADGTVLGRPSVLSKDNSGFDLKQLFIGSEGTLGIVTKVTLALKPAPHMTALALGRVTGLAQAQALLIQLRRRMGQRLSAFEYITGRVYDAVIAGGRPAPLAPGHPAYVLVEIEAQSEACRDEWEAALADAMEQGLLPDAVIGISGREQAALWDLRDGCSDEIFNRSNMYGFDIGIAPDKLGPFLDSAEAAVLDCDPDATLWVFGHLGDGNLHYIMQTTCYDAIAPRIYALVGAHDGALSAEHGIGREKPAYLPLVRTPAEIATLRRLKSALDPLGILNAGRVLPAPSERLP